MRGMYGAGDCVHQRAVLRELMKAHEVWLESPSFAQFHDFVEQGMKICRIGKMEPRIREATIVNETRLPRNASGVRMTYNKATVERYGSILAAIFACAGVKMPERPDFSLPIPDAWRRRVRALIETWSPDKPLLIYRPVVLNPIFRCPARSPDAAIYATLFAAIRKRFFVVSLANLADGDGIVGPDADADVKLHKGELDFETMAALYAEADLVFANPGNATVFAQATGTPSITVYGGYESFTQTNAAGAHLAPTLAIEPVMPCECWTKEHACDKRIEIAPALERIEAFIASLPLARKAELACAS
jgi:ADP-heptose:LPS heptosyltransferase